MHTKYPDVRAYALPEKNVLVISCIDLRLTDNLLEFLHHDNLINRYDHVAIAGTSLTAFAEGENKDLFDKDKVGDNDFAAWKRMLDNHIKIAVELHDIRDVYMVEHLHCGAYETFLKKGEFASEKEEIAQHSFFAKQLSDEIRSKEHKYKKRVAVPDVQSTQKVHETEQKVEEYHLHVHCFIMDLRGQTRLLHTTNPTYKC